MLLPDRIFDIHAHLHKIPSRGLPCLSSGSIGPRNTGFDAWHERIGLQAGQPRLQGVLFSPLPCLHPNDVDRENELLLAELSLHPSCGGLLAVALESSQARTLDYLRDPCWAGLRPSGLPCCGEQASGACIDDDLPAWAWGLANERGLIVVQPLHLADSGRQCSIREQCCRYPQARFLLIPIVQEPGRSIAVRGLTMLSGLENVWLDVATVWDPIVLMALLREFGPRRLLWGSGSPAAAQEESGSQTSLPRDMGRAESVPDRSTGQDRLPSLYALQMAAEHFPLNTQDVQDILCDNALRLLRLKVETGTLTHDLYRHAKERMPGGTQLLAKRPEMMAPGQWPAYFREARGCDTWDLDGHHYYDFSYNGIGACLLGFRDLDVTRAVQRRINLGCMCTLNPPEEVELADLLCEIHPWADQVRFGRCGGESCAMAVRIARVTTGRSLIGICGYHGWHDWYLAANLGENDALRGHLLPGLAPSGVPVELRGTALTFAYNDRRQFEAIIDTYGDRLAAVIMEPCRSKDPEPGFLECVRDGAHQHGALLIFDEITIGWRLHRGGAHLRFGVNPDVAVFAKALGNGHPIGAVVGTRAAMEGAHHSFISSTSWTESVGPAAALATLRKMLVVDVPAHVDRVGKQIQGFWRELGAKHGLPVMVDNCYPCVAHFGFTHEQAGALATLYTQLMLQRGFLAGTAVYPTLAHTDDVIGLYGRAIDEVFTEIAVALASDQVQKKLKGPVAHTGFRRLVS